MKTPSLLAFFFAFWSFSQATSTSGIPSKSSRVLQTAGDISIPQTSVNIENLFTLSYTFKPVGYITMTIKFKLPNQYFGIGFGTVMTGADIWVFQIANGEITVSDRVGTGRTSPKLDTSQGGKSDVERLGYEITSSYSLVKVRRALNTSDLFDSVISQGMVNMIYAYGTGPTMAYHGKGQRGTVIVPIVPGAGDFSVEDISGSEEKAFLDDIHALINLIVWGVLADLGIIFVRLMRGRKIMLRNIVIPPQMIHAFIMWIVIIMSIAVTIFMVKENREERGMELLEEGDRDFHFINGLVIMSLMLITVFSGGISFVKLKPYEQKRKTMVRAKVIHRVSGILIYLLAKANIITGVLFHQEGKWEVAVYVYLGFLLLTHIAIQVIYTKKFQRSNHSPFDEYKVVANPLNKALVEAINKGLSRELIIKNFPDIKWVMLGNKIYNLTGWIHPGGNFIIEACVGREIGRYFYGNYNLEGTRINPHKHSALTVSQLSSFYIGELINYESIFLLKKGDKTTLSRQNDHWRITRITPISENISEVAFRNPNFQIKNFGKSLTWLGRHFRVSFDRDDSLARLYTTALSLNRPNTYLRQSIYRYFDEIMSGNTSAIFIHDQSYFASQSSISLFIKNYRGFKGLSNAIHQTKITTLANKFRLEGPIGRGLELTPRSSGTHCIICSGTGILPMVDFLNLFLWKTMYQLIKAKAGLEKAQQINPLNLQFDNFFNDMSIKFIGAFTGPNEIIGLDIIKKLAEISKKYNTNNFEAMIKGYSDENIQALVGDFSSISFLGKILNKRENKYYVVGPPKFNEDIPNALSLFGVASERIMIV